MVSTAFTETRVISFSIREGLTAEEVDSVLAGPDGNIWIGNIEALDVLKKGKLSSIGAAQGLPGRLITSLFEDSQGRLWVGIDNGLTVYDHGRFHAVNRPDGQPLGVVVSIVEDTDQNIWVAATRPPLYRIQGTAVQEEIPQERIPRVMAMAADPKSRHLAGTRQRRFGALSAGPSRSFAQQPVAKANDSQPAGRVRRIGWAATTKGVSFWKDGKEQVLDSHNGLPCDEMYSLIKDNHGPLWLDTQCGLVIVASSEAATLATGSRRQCCLYDWTLSMVRNRGSRISGRKSPSRKTASCGLPTKNILQMVDPEHLAGNNVPPPVHVEQVIADRKKYSAKAGLQLPARTRDIEIDYTALSLMVPEKVQFRYKLEGHDTEWQDPQHRRAAFYSDLSPGNYQFRVIASNNDGVWNDAGARVSLPSARHFFRPCGFEFHALCWGL